MKTFRKFCEALSDDEYMKRARENENVYKEIETLIESFDKPMSKLKSGIAYGNIKIKDEAKKIQVICQDLINELKKLKELS